MDITYPGTAAENYPVAAGKERYDVNPSRWWTYALLALALACSSAMLGNFMGTRFYANSTEGMSNTTQGMSNTTQGMSNTTQGMSNTTQGMSNTTQGMSNTTQGMSNTTQGMSNTTQGMSDTALGALANVTGGFQNTTIGGALDVPGPGSAPQTPAMNPAGKGGREF